MVLWSPIGTPGSQAGPVSLTAEFPEVDLAAAGARKPKAKVKVKKI